MDEAKTTFWDHLEALRGCLLRSVAVVAVAGMVAFFFKDTLFSIVLAPCSSNFVTYRLLGGEPFEVNLMNIALTEQFVIHLKVAIYAGLLLASPYVIWQLFGFISPALYAKERQATLKIGASAYVMFMVGAAVSYFLIFPLTLKLLSTYQVSPDVENRLTLQSYVDTLLSLTLVMGIVFELPVVCAMLSRMNLISKQLMQHYRRHAIVVILVATALLTPSGDAFTLMIVSLPIYLLYELSIFMVRSKEIKTET